MVLGLAALTVLAGACRDRVPYPDEVSWEVAVEALNRGEVEQIVQYHSLVVDFELKDGSSFSTVEPRIDAIFDEIEDCGWRCRNVGQITE